jgi:hypothetical protein
MKGAFEMDDFEDEAVFTPEPAYTVTRNADGGYTVEYVYTQEVHAALAATVNIPYGVDFRYAPDGYVHMAHFGQTGSFEVREEPLFIGFVPCERREEHR